MSYPNRLTDSCSRDHFRKLCQHEHSLHAPRKCNNPRDRGHRCEHPQFYSRLRKKSFYCSSTFCTSDFVYALFYLHVYAIVALQAQWCASHGGICCGGGICPWPILCWCATATLSRPSLTLPTNTTLVILLLIYYGPCYIRQDSILQKVRTNRRVAITFTCTWPNQDLPNIHFTKAWSLI